MARTLGALGFIIALVGLAAARAGFPWAALVVAPLLAALLGWTLGARLLEPFVRLSRRLPDSSRPLTLAKDGEFTLLAAQVESHIARLEEELGTARDERDQVLAVLDRMVEGVLVLGPDDEVLFANPRARELLDIWSDFQGRRLIEVVRHREIHDTLAAALRSGEVEIRDIGPLGSDERFLRVHAVALTDPASGERGSLLVMHDVSELQRLDQMRSDFIANASHELRTPLTSILGFTEALSGGDLSLEDQKSYVRVLDRNARRLRDLVEDLLSLARIEGRRTPIQPCEFDLVHACHNMADDLAARIASKGLEIVVSGDARVIAWADPRAVDHVIGNLLDNAIKYTQAGGRIEVRCVREAGAARLAVSDTGFGIPSADLDRIFERFYRVDKARARALGGTGLGLSIVKHLVQAMDGQIHVTSELDRGTTFSVSLPLPPAPSANTSQ